MTGTLTSLRLRLDGQTSGKVRESWPLPDGRRLLVTTDRFSAMDRIVGAAVHKGQVLNRLAAWWFDRVADLVDHHLLSVPDPNCPIVADVTPLPVEVIVRGHITGSTKTSLWTLYEQGGRHLYGHALPEGLRRHEMLPAPLVTPTTKAHEGHDMPMSRKEVKNMVGESLADELEEKSLAIYNYARGYAIARGIIIADTKFEFGLDGDKLIIIDELLTPDSSRIWEVDLYKVGQSQPSFDKQPVRDWLSDSGWDKTPPAPMLPEEVIEATAKRYERAYQRLTGKKL